MSKLNPARSEQLDQLDQIKYQILTCQSMTRAVIALIQQCVDFLDLHKNDDLSDSNFLSNLTAEKMGEIYDAVETFQTSLKRGEA